MSLQEYVLAELEYSAITRTPAELVADVESRMRVEGPEGYSRTAAASVVRSDRSSH